MSESRRPTRSEAAAAVTVNSEMPQPLSAAPAVAAVAGAAAVRHGRGRPGLLPQCQSLSVQPSDEPGASDSDMNVIGLMIPFQV
jgi:metal-dependent HD superfamily phosphatase/phosphodiesterase